MPESSEATQNPTYSLPPRMLARLAWAILFNRKRSYHKDARLAMAGMRPSAVIHNPENAPSEGPCLLTLNHYYREGYGAWWSTLAISAILPFDIHWIMTGMLTYPSQKKEIIMKPASHWVLHRIARVYGFTNMPAMPPDPKEATQRANAVRKAVAFARKADKPIIGLAPEGRDIITGQLGEPPSGAGRFMAVLTRYGLPLYPVGVYEDEGHLHVSFGEAYQLEIPPGMSSQELDHAAAEIVMRAIGRQLPDRMRGCYG